MARKQKNPPREPDRSAADYYKLNLKAVDDLVTADESNSPRVSEAELRKYRSGPKVRLSETFKALLIKFWFNGATCFFFLWGLGTYLHSWLDQVVVLALAMGAVNDLLTNNVLRFWAKTPGGNDRWMMFPQRAFYTLPLNVLYGLGYVAGQAQAYGAKRPGGCQARLKGSVVVHVSCHLRRLDLGVL